MSESKVRMQFFAKAEAAAKIDELAERMNMSRAQFLEMLTDEALKDNEWIIRAVTHPMVDAVVQVLGVRRRKNQDRPARPTAQGR